MTNYEYYLNIIRPVQIGFVDFFDIISILINGNAFTIL